jgi:hypothetical protein
MRRRTTLLSCFLLCAAIVPVHADTPDPLAAAGTTPIVTTKVTRPENREPPPYTELEIFGRKGTAAPVRNVARPQSFRFESYGDWAGGFEGGRTSFASNTDMILRSGGESEVRIDIRRTEDIPSVHFAIDAAYKKVVAETGVEPTDLFPAEDTRVAFVYKVRERRHSHRQVLYAVYRLPSQPKDYTVIVRAEWPYRQRAVRQGQLEHILRTLRFE